MVYPTLSQVKKQLEKVEKQEQKYLNQKENALQKKKKAFSHTLEQKIPLKLRKSIQNAFYKGFLVIFEKGTDVIEKTYDKENNKFYHDISWDYIKPLWDEDGLEMMIIKNTSVFLKKVFRSSR